MEKVNLMSKMIVRGNDVSILPDAKDCYLSYDDVRWIVKNCEEFKDDFARCTRQNYSYICITQMDVKKVLIDDKKYYMAQVTRADISTIKDTLFGTEYGDGELMIDGDQDILQYFRCLIDPISGKYIFYPNREKKKISFLEKIKNHFKF